MQDKGERSIYTFSWRDSNRAPGPRTAFHTALPPHFRLACWTSRANRFHVTPPIRHEAHHGIVRNTLGHSAADWGQSEIQ